MIRASEIELISSNVAFIEKYIDDELFHDEVAVAAEHLLDKKILFDDPAMRGKLAEILRGYYAKTYNGLLQRADTGADPELRDFAQSDARG